VDLDTYLASGVKKRLFVAEDIPSEVDVQIQLPKGLDEFLPPGTFSEDEEGDVKNFLLLQVGGSGKAGVVPQAEEKSGKVG